MVIFIGGCSCTGKTYLADRLLKIHNIPYFSIDYLKMGLYRSDSNCGFIPTDRDDVIAEKLWTIVRGMTKTYIENNQNIIIEGCYIMPYHMQDFSEEYRGEIISLFLGFSRKYIIDNFETGIIKNRSVIETRKYEEERSKEWFVQEHDKFRAMCKSANANYFEVDSDYNKEIDEVIRFVNETIVKNTDRRQTNEK